MKFNQKITSPAEAERFIDDLCKNDLAFHFDDDVKETFKGRFEDLEIKQLDSRINEIFEILEDPFEYLHKYWNKYQTTK